MLKKQSKRLALLMALIMVVAVIASGCGGDKGGDSSTTGDGAAASGPFNYGINTWGSGVPILDMFGDVEDWTIKTMGDTDVRASDDFTSDKELTNFQNFISQKVDGIVLQAASPPTLPQMADAATAAKIPFVLSVFIGDDADVDTIQANNEYFVGAIDSDMVEDGRGIAQEALDNGCKTALIIGGNIGDNNMDQRIQGFKEVFEAAGGKVVAEARCTDASEAPAKAEDMLSANKDADCLYALVGDYIPGSIGAIDNLGLKDLKVFVSCVDELSAQYIKEGRIISGHDGISLASFLAPTLIHNWLSGNKILDENGKGPHLRTTPFIVNQANADAYISVFYSKAGLQPFTKEMIDNLTGPDANYASYTELIANGLQLNNFLEANGLPTV
ncbi:MAG: substrate-binding domain-containing protein [Clostridiales Family XIII bacterium]|nr:substrate-binding domain-containing protein [Clostridiales Family XIII bacterium]